MNRKLKFSGLLQNEKWIQPAFVELNESGNIVSIDDSSANPSDFESVNGYAIPGFQNAHSHAFQYAMAGLAEVHDTNKEADDFWSWRDAMYKLALTISPEDLKDIASMLYLEMLRHGYTHVAEFHYVHHDKEGNNYSNLSEMGEQLVAAAKEVGIGITLVPIFYQKGGFGKSPVDGQKRFISSTIADYQNLLEASRKSAELYDNANIAIGIHSMRGVEPNDIVSVANNFDQNLPFHIHISEQLKEVEDSLAYLGKRPVDWLASNIQLTDRFHLVHATHLVKEEIEAIASSGANVVLCPSTEGNLGDGIFPLIDFQKMGGNWSIGTDSHIGINPLEELRILDYGQRLISHKRNIFNGDGIGDSGVYGIRKSLIAGRKAMGNNQTEFFKIGSPFNAAVYDATNPLLATCKPENIASTLVYASDSRMLLNTFVNGESLIHCKRHDKEELITKNFISTMNKLAVR